MVFSVCVLSVAVLLHVTCADNNGFGGNDNYYGFGGYDGNQHPCNQLDCENGYCATMPMPHCVCNPGWSGPRCQILTSPKHAMVTGGLSGEVHAAAAMSAFGAARKSKPGVNKGNSLNNWNGGMYPYMMYGGDGGDFNDGVMYHSCAFIQCQNGGRCQQQGFDSYCICRKGFSGNRCQNADSNSVFSTVQSQFPRNQMTNSIRQNKPAIPLRIGSNTPLSTFRGTSMNPQNRQTGQSRTLNPARPAMSNSVYPMNPGMNQGMNQNTWSQTLPSLGFQSNQVMPRVQGNQIGQRAPRWSNGGYNGYTGYNANPILW